MTEEEKQEIQALFLNNGKVVEWEKPPRIQRPDLFYIEALAKPDASTELVSFLGFDRLYEHVSQYHVIASAAKYKAKIAFCGDKINRFDNEKTSNNPEDMILFAGAIAIYKEGVIPGTELNGLDFVRHGKIFIARKPSPVLRSSEGLKNLIFEDATIDKDKIARIESIIRGYEDQKLAKNSRQSKRMYEEYRRGASDHHEAAFGTFSHVPFEFP